jgi:hypothetical protein
MASLIKVTEYGATSDPIIINRDHVVSAKRKTVQGRSSGRDAEYTELVLSNSGVLNIHEDLDTLLRA